MIYRAWFTGLLLLVSGSVHSHLLGIVPENPTADQPVQFVWAFKGCPLQPFENVDGLSHEIRVNDFEIDFYYGERAKEPCPLPPPGPILTYDLGFLPPGDYTFRAIGILSTQSFPSDMTEVTPYVGTFSVGEPAPQTIPALGGTFTTILILLVIVVTMYSRQLRQRADASGNEP